MIWPSSIPGCPYTLDSRPFGAGGYAYVFRGTHPATGREVAVKTFRPLKNARDRKPAARLRNEIAALRAMSHPNVMPVLDVAADLSWYSMPLAQGSLYKMGPQTGLSLVDCLRHVALGLSHAHSLGMLHRDVAPGNILWVPSQPARWVVGDWGLVLPTDAGDQLRLTTQGAVVGTPGFRAPELYEGETGGQHSDIYSLGRVAAWSLTGIHPDGPASIPVTDPLWGPLVDQMTARFPADRQGSMYEVLLRLGELAEHLADLDRCLRCRSIVGDSTRCATCGHFVPAY